MGFLPKMCANSVAKTSLGVKWITSSLLFIFMLCCGPCSLCWCVLYSMCVFVNACLLFHIRKTLRFHPHFLWQSNFFVRHHRLFNSSFLFVIWVREFWFARKKCPNQLFDEVDAKIRCHFFSTSSRYLPVVLLAKSLMVKLSCFLFAIVYLNGIWTFAKFSRAPSSLWPRLPRATEGKETRWELKRVRKRWTKWKIATQRQSKRKRWLFFVSIFRRRRRRESPS